MKILVVVGNDKLGRLLADRLRSARDLQIVLDCSSGVARVVKLLRRGSLRFPMLIKMLWAEWMRPNRSEAPLMRIRSIDELLRTVEHLRIDRVYLFRAGLIVNAEALRSGVEWLNLHCASLPRYGGLGAISRALADGAYHQEATLHRVSERIDGGESVASKPFRLDPMRSYAQNESMAYEVGMDLLIEHLGRMTGQHSDEQ